MLSLCSLLLLPPADAELSSQQQGQRAAQSCVNFTSGSTFLTAWPPFVARGVGWPRALLGFKGVNARVRDGLVELVKTAGPPKPRERRLSGMVLLMDYVQEPAGLLELVIELNWLLP